MSTSPTRRTAGRAGEAGFTLVELLITLSVTLIGMTGLLQLHGSMSRTNQVSARQLEGTAFAEDLVEAVRGLSEAELVATYGALPIDVDLVPVRGRNDLELRRHLFVELVGDEPMRLLRLRAEVAWTDGGAEPGAEGGRHDHLVVLEVLRAPQGAQ